MFAQETIHWLNQMNLAVLNAQLRSATFMWLARLVKLKMALKKVKRSSLARYLHKYPNAIILMQMISRM